MLMFGTAQAVLIRGVSLFQESYYFRGSLFQGCPYSGIPLSVLHTDHVARGETEFPKMWGGEGVYDVLTFQKSGGQELS